MSERRENSVARRTKESARERDKAAATAVVAADAAAVGPVKVPPRLPLPVLLLLPPPL